MRHSHDGGKTWHDHDGGENYLLAHDHEDDMFVVLVDGTTEWLH